MLSYRHAFHAGNHADVLKHCVLLELLAYLGQKDKPFLFVDTHAGAGRYALESEQARKTAEFRGGVGTLWGHRDLPPPLERYLATIRRFNREGSLRFYPGSPVIAAEAMRPEDRLALFELHPADHAFLEKALGTDRRVRIARTDGFGALKAVLPPPSRRALVLIDPPYERREDYRLLLDAMGEALRRFAGGTYALWYPRLQKTESKQLVERLRRLPIDAWLHVWLDVQRPAPGGLGMHGSGLFIVNPPWTLPDALGAVMPALVDALGVDEGARFGLEHEIP